jgi:hypothetical protein
LWLLFRPPGERRCAVVHVGRGAGDLAQRRRAERAAVPLGASDGHAAAIAGRDRHAGVMELAVGEVRADVAGAAAGAADEELEAGPLLVGQGVPLARLIAPGHSPNCWALRESISTVSTLLHRRADDLRG